MKIASLSPDQAPPISVPLRFFAVAPVFLVLAALLLAMGDDNPFTNPHSPALLAATHCITLGFAAMVMVGAIQQVVPVIIGSQMPAPRMMAWLTMLPLTVGALLLTLGFALGKPELLNLSWSLLGLAFLIFIIASLYSLTRATPKNPTKTALLLSVISLAAAVGLGMLLARGYAAGLDIPYAKLATAHISLALGGWVMLLTIGVSYQVVPMFQLTPSYPKWLTDYLTPAIFAALLSSLLPLLFETAPRWPELVAETLFWILACCYAAVTLKLQSQRRRRVPDATLSFFRLGMVALLVAALFSLASLLLPAAFLSQESGDHLRMLSALAFLLGFAMSVIQGMLYKIIPFLVWFHLFRGEINTANIRIPNMKEIIPERWMWWHLKLHGITLLAALLATRWDWAAWLVELGLLLQGILLGYAIFIGISVYRDTLERIEQASTTGFPPVQE
jgi:hypothetical protein